MKAIEPVPGDKPVPELTITRGREPIRPLELAVGRLTLERLGLDLGDEVTVSGTVSGGPREQFTIVGEVVVNSTDEGSPGFGALAVAETLPRYDPAAEADIVVVDLADGPRGDAARAVIERRAAESGGEFSVSPPIRQTAVGNLARLRSLPYVLATLIAVLAAGSLAHALVVSLRRNRRQLAVLKAIGFTRPQVSSVVAWQATTLAGHRVAVRDPARGPRGPVGVAGDRRPAGRGRRAGPATPRHRRGGRWRCWPSPTWPPSGRGGARRECRPRWPCAPSSRLCHTRGVALRTSSPDVADCCPGRKDGTR